MRVVHPFRDPTRARVDAGFLDPRYPGWRKSAGLPPAEHPGVDYNLQGTSGDQDYGYPVCAVAMGRVVHAASHRVWGNIVLIEHPTLAELLGLPYLATQYAHLAFISVREGDVVLAGEAIGSVGKGDPRAPFLAHLHFEVRKKPLPPDYWPGMDRRAIQDAYLDPVAFLATHLEEEHRYWFPAGTLYLPGGAWTTKKPVVVNLSLPELARVRLNESL
ncbi:M23 family metallopeptidase [Thermus sp. PS18]|uniref:M23 family metallopeptidase n=1 Tax=Thermus sp. PS18 TaxID=2849039 RepID=UPI002264D6FD|nr:M23 family metallopeptidase [Thermus sp. PS18]UZX16574.1 M23 family metallopeptidase [Thermus sp. PS18]